MPILEYGGFSNFQSEGGSTFARDTRFAPKDTQYARPICSLSNSVDGMLLRPSVAELSVREADGAGPFCRHFRNSRL